MRFSDLRIPQGIRFTVSYSGDLEETALGAIWEPVRIDYYQDGRWAGSSTVSRVDFDGEGMTQSIQDFVDRLARPRVVSGSPHRGSVEALVFCPKCGPARLQSVAARRRNEMHRWVNAEQLAWLASRVEPMHETHLWIDAEQLAALRNTLPTMKCEKCHGSMSLKVFSELRLVKDDDSSME